METRKVQRTGKSTYVVSIPKSWANRNGIQAGSLLYIKQGDNGDLMLSTDRAELSLRAKLDIGRKSGEALVRDIIGCYVNGYRTLEIGSSQMSASQKKDIRRITNKLIGPEIFEESSNKIVIQDLLSSEELQMERALKRIKLMVRSMINDAIAALTTRNLELAEDVFQRDDDVDKMNLLISRQFTEILRRGSMRQESCNMIAALNYMQAASNMERIADHCARIAEIARDQSYDLPQEIIEYLCRLNSNLTGLMDECITALLHNDCESANKLIDRARETKEGSKIMANSTKIRNKEEMQVRLV